MNDYRDHERENIKDILQRMPEFKSHACELLQLFDRGWEKIQRHGDLQRWQTGFYALPQVTPSSIDFNTDRVRIGRASDTEQSQASITSSLQAMHPWRKGPFDIFGVHIDTEWRSDWKWQRVQPHLSPLQGRNILDVGCGSGYHIWRMLGEGASFVLGIDPTPLFSMHFATVKQYQPHAPAYLLPVGIDDMPERMHNFDTVFSMGILYHRRSPLDHLSQLKDLLRQGGELVLETLIVDGDENTCLIPKGRYAKMRNVWFIPSIAMLAVWLKRCGFKNIRCVDVAVTSTDEQRSTDWMQFESLSNFLNPDDASQTIEAYPAPKRAVFIAESI
ncbi:MAG: tRNA 5-methoxyuridine(34)/uridine 5-oxyacetic acid(34) synthase CmoB [Zetaproteobacteria bacterium]|nr:tRNA 5-methoxyuridine(34)/uridine 5-oxyacetic acid(34) synthase CmoB [Zetaproteobacteria bacterium]